MNQPNSKMSTTSPLAHREAVDFLFYDIFSQPSPSKLTHDISGLFYSYVCLHCLFPILLLLKQFPLVLAFLLIKSGENHYSMEENTDHKVHWRGPRDRSTKSLCLPPSLMTFKTCIFYTNLLSFSSITCERTLA